jgi:hypothetical protein
MADVVLNSLGIETWENSFASMGLNGRWVTFGGLTGADVKLNIQSLYSKQVRLKGSTGSTRKEITELIDMSKELKTGIIVTMVLTFYYYRRQTHNLSVDVETKILNNLDEKVHRLNAIMIEHPELGKKRNLPALSLETTYSFDVLNISSHAYDMRERKVLSEDEWNGWLYCMRSCFK